MYIYIYKSVKSIYMYMYIVGQIIYNSNHNIVQKAGINNTQIYKVEKHSFVPLFFFKF